MINTIGSYGSIHFALQNTHHERKNHTDSLIFNTLISIFNSFSISNSLYLIKKATLNRLLRFAIAITLVLCPAMQVLHANNTPSIINMHYKFPDNGAIETHLLIFNKLLQDHGISNTIATSTGSTFVLEQASQQGLACTTFNHQDWGPRATDLEPLCIQNAPTIICNGIGHLTTGIALHATHNNPIILMHHYFFSELLANSIPAINNIQGIVTVSPLVAQQLQDLQKKGIVKVPHIKHIAPFWNDQKFLDFSPHRSKVDFFAQEYGINLQENTPVITMLANLYWCKNQALLLKSLQLLQRKNPLLQVVFAGEGNDRKELEALARELKLERIAHFIGRTEKTPELLHHSTIHVLTSSHEGLGIAYLEAAMMKKPFIAATGTGIEPIIQKGITGLVFENNNVEDLTNKLAILLEAPQLCKVMGDNAYTFVRKHYSTEALFKNWLDFFAAINKQK